MLDLDDALRISSRTIDISVVVATCSRAELLKGALQSLLTQEMRTPAAVELVVVDDGSKDQTAEVLAQVKREARIPVRVVQGEGKGVAAARNLGVSHARGSWLASFDDDQIALPGWLEALYGTAQETGAVCVGGALHLQLPPGYTLESLGPRTRSILGEHLPGPAGAYPAKVRPATNNVLMRRDVFNAMGGYDTRFTEGAEDADFFDRVMAAGYRLCFEPQAQALHLIPARRLERGSLRWTSLRIGAGDARLEQRKRPGLGPVRLAALRIAVSLARDLPRLALSAARRNQRAELDVKCSLWYTEGLLRALPGILSKEQDSEFLRSLNFRARNGERPASQ